ncbi:MAG: hypothetical protein S4CHLAM123_09090 [Chlamydiales bacterium]|nr:hypothetical protein [Chlamydiales bacterium]
MTVLYFVLAAAALGVLVFIHELGHYFVAKKTGMIVEIFSIGFGRPILKWRLNNVNWQLGWLPFGGYVKIKGMELTKKDKDTYIEPHEIPNGFFAQSPWKRIAVALAGPFANFILAFLIFTAVWAMGGREKPFSEFTQIVGWVDPQSDLYSEGLRPGDVLTHLNGKPYTSTKDLLYASMLGGKQVEIKGYHVDQTTQTQKPFDYSIESYPAPNSLDGILTTGIASGARYLIYDKLTDGTENALPEGSPMQSSGIKYKDRLVWADGEYLYSMDQLSYVLNNNQALLTVKRDGETFLTRQPRVLTNDVILHPNLRNELIDWQYETQIKTNFSDLYILPYVVSSEGYIEAPLEFIDQESKRAAFPLHSYSKTLSDSLQPGDRILAVDGVPITQGFAILKQLQSHKVQLIAEQNVPLDTKVSWKVEDQVFEKAIDTSAIDTLAANIGTENPIQSFGRFTLLNPVEPKRINQFDLSKQAQERLDNEYESQKKQIAEIKNRDKRVKALDYLDASYEKYLLGIYLQDRQVDYNPSPVTMFGSVFTETWQTLRALVTGYLHPKWISGPVGIVQVIHHGWRTGLGEALFWIGAISVNLGVLNLLPIPVLDGGYVCLSLWELITRRRLKAKTMERLIIPFVVLLMGLLVFLTFQDLTRLF